MPGQALEAYDIHKGNSIRIIPDFSMEILKPSWIHVTDSSSEKYEAFYHS